jgi:hypothetical protein
VVYVNEEGSVPYRSSGAVVVGHLALVVGPEGVEEAAVGARAGGRGAVLKGVGFTLLAVHVESERRGERHAGAAESEQDGRESDHDG